MTVIQIPKRTTTTQPKRLTATLTLLPTAKYASGASGGLKGDYMGLLTVKDFTFAVDDGNPMGLAAYVMNIGTLNVISPSFQAGSIRLMASRAVFPREAQRLHESGNPRQQAQALYLMRAWVALRNSFNSTRQVKSLLEWWATDLLPPVVRRIPAELRVNTTLVPGIYDKDGMPLTPQQQGRCGT